MLFIETPLAPMSDTGGMGRRYNVVDVDANEVEPGRDVAVREVVRGVVRGVVLGVVIGVVLGVGLGVVIGVVRGVVLGVVRRVVLSVDCVPVRTVVRAVVVTGFAVEGARDDER